MKKPFPWGERLLKIGSFRRSLRRHYPVQVPGVYSQPALTGFLSDVCEHPHGPGRLYHDKRRMWTVRVEKYRLELSVY